MLLESSLHLHMPLRAYLMRYLEDLLDIFRNRINISYASLLGNNPHQLVRVKTSLPCNPFKVLVHIQKLLALKDSLDIGKSKMRLYTA